MFSRALLRLGPNIVNSSNERYVTGYGVPLPVKVFGKIRKHVKVIYPKSMYYDEHTYTKNKLIVYGGKFMSYGFILFNSDVVRK
jgi:hypothetical protein